jgi:hypothetical protein
VEDERTNQMHWEDFEEDHEWDGWQGHYANGRWDPALEEINDLNASPGQPHNLVLGDALGFESRNRGPYTGGRGSRRTPGPQGTRGTAWWQVNGPHSGKGPRGYQRRDERIWEDVCDRLTQHGGLDASRIEVEVKEGEVTLRGQTAGRKAKRLAEAIVDSVAGVRDVNNQLQIPRRATAEPDRDAA